MDVFLMVDPANEEIVAETIQAVDPTLLSAAPESREYMDAQSLIKFGLHAVQHLDAVSVLVGVLLAKHIKVRIEVGGIPLTAKTLKEGLDLIRNLQKLLSNEDAPKPDAPEKHRKRK
jgi:hypothetical protein